MNEEVFKEILAKAVDSEFAGFDNAPKHRFRFRHRLAMNRIFARFERNAHKLREKGTGEICPTNKEKPYTSIKQRLIIVTVIVILMTFLVGWVAIYVAGNFNGTVYPDNTHLTITNIDGSPQTIEYRYTLASVPEGFELIETDITPINVYTVYMNRSTKQTIVLRQWVKSKFEPHYNTEHQPLEEVSINGSTGLCIDLSDDEHSHSLVVWDNGDYVLDLMADLDKNTVINLAKLNKI